MTDKAKYTSFSWLIEAPGPTYLGARDLGKREFYWTRDHNSALRFFNAEQADGVMMAVREMSPDLFSFALSLGVDAKPIEHGWMCNAIEIGREAGRKVAPKEDACSHSEAFEAIKFCVRWMKIWAANHDSRIAVSEDELLQEFRRSIKP